MKSNFCYIIQKKNNPELQNSVRKWQFYFFFYEPVPNGTKNTLVCQDFDLRNINISTN